MRAPAIAIAAILAAAGSAPGSAQADKLSDWTPQVAPVKEAAAALRAERYADAIPLLERHLAGEPTDADAWTYLGYAQRKTGAFRSSRRAYEKALALDPDHLDAHAYFGALMVDTGDAAGLARQQATLAALCPDGCPARDALAAAVAGAPKPPW